ncbi:TonB-dependent receptor [Acidobacteria bacterium AB60]|nr:TonB-dependent receptor [Acidobacteria bacterium AB60]
MKSFLAILRGLFESIIAATRGAVSPILLQRVCLLLLVAGLWLVPLRAQQAPATAAWQGVLQNAARAPLAGATVRLSGGGNTAEATTGNDGRFRMQAVPVGRYRLTILANGRTVESGQTVDVGPESAPVAIEISDRGELTMSAAQAQAGTGGEALSSQAVSELPLNKRDFSQLLLLAAGTMTDANGATNFTQQFAINGQRGVEATFAMDGADISDPEMGGSTFSNFNVDAVEGIDSTSGWLPAEVGRGAAGFTNIHTRSGASGFHGSFFEFVRNSAFDARNYFDHPTPAYPGRIPPFRRNEFGFTNGGPVYLPHVYDGRKRTYYFVQYQGFRQVLGTTQVMPVPTASERAGVDVVKFPDGSTDTLNVPVDPGIAAVLARYPMPNNPGGAFGARTYATASKVVTNANQFSVRFDHRITSKDQFFARFSLDNLTGPTTNPDQTAIDSAFGVKYIDRQRNVVGTWTRTVSPQLTFESSISITRSTPGFPTADHTDPGLKFNDALYEAFNSAAGSVMQAYGNLFHGRENVSYLRGRHAFKAGAEVRLNRDTTYFGTSPNGEYDFGGGKAYANETILSQSGMHDIHPGDPLPDTLSGFLSGSPFAYTVAIAPPGISSGEHIGPAAINRNNVSAYVQDTWKVTPTVTLDYGVRWDLYTPIAERAHRTAAFRTINGTQQYVVNPQPGYQTNWHAFEPRVQVAWQATSKVQVHAGAAIMAIPPNIWQDNFLTGSTPFVMYPRLLSASANPIHYGFQITPNELPGVFTPGGAQIPLSNNTKSIHANTVMDVDRFEKDLAALTKPSQGVSALNLSGIDLKFNNATMYTWTLGLERKIGNLTADAAYVGTASEKLPRYSFPNAYAGASPGFAPHTEFDSAGNVIGGFGVENVIVSDAHSTYHALQTSLSGTMGHGGPGVQASYTWSKSLDDTSLVLGGTGSTGAAASGFSQNPYDTHGEKGPSNFDVTHGFGLSLAQDLHLQQAPGLQAVPRSVTGGWELLSISSISSGSPFTVYSGIQQTGYGSNGVDRPDQIAKPKLSTARKVREDYFGHGGDNGVDFFSIPVHVPGGSGPNDGRFGTLGRNTFRGPAFYNFDFALIKDTPFGRRRSGAEVMDLQFRSEFFNLFNIVTMGLPSNTLQVNQTTGEILRDTGFGVISKTAGNSRQIQFSLKLIY